VVADLVRAGEVGEAVSNRRLRGQAEARAAIRGKKRPDGPLTFLHEFFLATQRANILRRRDGGTPQKRSDPKWGRLRAALAKLWKSGEPQRLASVAVCPRCPEWFPTTEERNLHRANSCEKRP
jgi:hypothetical protein